MHSEQLDLNLLMVFDALLRENSVTKASESLGLTQSATSHALNRLRVYFDDPLFVKVGTRMEPTSKAAGLRQAVVDVVANVRQNILPGSTFNPAVAKRIFTICMTDMGELVFLPALLERFKREAPHCTLRTVQVPVEQIESLLASGEADLALGSIRVVPEGLYQQRLFLHQFRTIASVRNRKITDTLTRELFACGGVADRPHHRELRQSAGEPRHTAQYRRHHPAFFDGALADGPPPRFAGHRA